MSGMVILWKGILEQDILLPSKALYYVTKTIRKTAFWIRQLRYCEQMFSIGR